jgi:hypothetical protein
MSWWSPPNTRMFKVASWQYLKTPGCNSRKRSTALHFYQNRQLERYSSKEAKRLTLRQLVALLSLVSHPGSGATQIPDLQVFFGRTMDEERLIKVLDAFFHVLTLTLWLWPTECQLCPHRATRAHCAQTTRLASSALCCGDTRRCCKSLRSSFPVFPCLT